MFLYTYIVRVNGRDSRKGVLVNEVDRHFLSAVAGPGIQIGEHFFDFVVSEYVLGIGPASCWNISHAAFNLGDDTKVVACSLESPEKIYPWTTLVQYKILTVEASTTTRFLARRQLTCIVRS